MITANQSPIQQAEALLGSPYLSLDLVKLYRSDPTPLADRLQPRTKAVLQVGLRQAIAVHNEALLEHVPTPDVDHLKQMIRDHLMPTGDNDSFDASQLDDVVKQAGRMLQSFLDSDHARLPDGHHIVGIEHDVNGFIGSDLPPVHGRADLVTVASHGVVVTNYRIAEPTDIEQAVDEYADELQLLGALVAGSVDDHSRLAGLRLVIITMNAAPQVHQHHIPIDESRLQATIELVKSTWQSIVNHHVS